MPAAKPSIEMVEVVETPTEKIQATTNGNYPLSGMDFQMVEKLFRSAHGKARTIAKSDSADEDVLIAKLADFAIRELHAKGVRPLTAIRAMTIMETAEEKRSILGAINQAFREMRAEAKAKRASESGEEDKENKENISVNGKVDK